MAHYRRDVLVLLGATAVRQCLRLGRRIVCAIQGIDFAPCNGLCIRRLKFVQRSPQALAVETPPFEGAS
jgi:hypothetical protein